MSNLWLLFLILGLYLILKFKSVFLKLILGVFWYPLVTMYLYCIDYELGGSLYYIGGTIHKPYCKEAFVYAIAGYYTLIAIVWKLRNLKFSFQKIKSNELSRSIFVCIFFVVAVIAFPKAFGIGSQRWNLIPGPWPVVFIAMNLVLFTSFESLKQKSSIAHLLILSICFVGGERATSALVLLLFFLFVPYNKYYMIEKKIKYYYAVVFLLIAVLGIAAQSWRSGKLFSLESLYVNLISLTTVSDVVHIYFSSFSYIEKYPLTLNPLINELASMFNIPGYGGATSLEYNFTEILREYIVNYGGGLFYTEGVLVFGKIGVLLYAVMYGFLIRFLYLNKSRFAQVVMLVFIVLQMRIQWYGFMYIYTPILLTYLFIKLLEILNKIKAY